tara:strand:- start:56 stop:583 length:528 start_codon:yes stop_codon:yes gene_type:complete
MTDITGARKNLQIQELQTESGVSEATFQKLGSSVNFVNNFQNKAFEYKFMGPFRAISGGEDGVRSLIFNAEIVGLSGYIRQSGTSGTTSIDIHSITGSTDNGTVLSTPLSITSSTADGIVFFTELLTPNSSGGTGITLPVFSTTDFSAGQGFRVDLTGNASDALDLTLTIHYRPR